MVTSRLFSALVLGASTLAGAEQPRAAAAVDTTAVSGRVTFSGRAPAADPIDVSSEPYCREGNGAPVRQRVRVDAQSGLADVIVHVKGVAATAAQPIPKEPAVLDQRGCMYRPSVLPIRVGQPLVVRNSDQIMHNVHASARLNPSFNIGQPMAGLEARRVMRAPELAIPVRCDIHDWMEASIAVFDHSFYAVTSSDGSFTISGLPPGEYEIEAWHPTLGKQTKRVKVADSDVRADFQFGGT